MMSTQSADKLREIRLTPYRKGCGPTFILRTYDANRTRGGKPVVRYEFIERDTTDTRSRKARNTVIFQGEDFACSPMHAIDSDECVAALLGFLTLKSGDTDREYFEDYTERQLEFRDSHAEALACEVYCRFGER